VGGKQYDLEGQRFGKLIVQHRQGSKNGNAMWYCTCDCGGDTVVSTTRLRGGEKAACGCTHGGKREYKAPKEVLKDRIEELEEENRELKEQAKQREKTIFDLKFGASA